MPPASERAVFLSYASQDADAARRICEALRASGVEVWFDQNELTGGDAWDAKIRKQIKDCALFVPIISANTQARTEGYFRLEWRLADQRTHLMAKGRPFLLPVVIDDTHDSDAHVPDSFTEVQWTRLPGGEAPPNFCARVQKLLAGDAATSATRPPIEIGKNTAQPTRRTSWLVPTVLGLTALVALAIWQPWRQKEKPTSASVPVAPAPAAASADSSETARIRARLIPDRWQKGDFEALSPTLDRLIQANPEDADAWALRSVINSLQVMRNFDSGTKPLETGKAAAERALRLAPESPLAELALGMHLVAMISRGGDAQAGRQRVAHAVAALPPDALTRYADLVSAWLGYDIERTEHSATAWLGAEPGATFPAWILAQLYITQRRPAEAEKWAEVAAADRNITGTRAFYTLFESKFYLRADLAAAKAALARIPSGAQGIHRVIHARWVLAMAEQHWDEALQQLAQVPETMLYDRTYHGPRALLAGLAHQRAGRADAALVQFREAERLLRSELAADADNEELHLVLAVTLACAGRPAEARSELALVEPLVKGQTASVYWGALALSITQTYGVLGDFGHMAEWLRKLFIEPSGFPFTPASFRLDPRFADTSDAPEIQALLKEFASLDQPSAGPASSVADEKSVAVLAFADNSPAHDSEYFSDGISEELINALGKIPGLKVPARTSSFYFKGKNLPMVDIAKQLGVAYLIEGSVQRVGEQVKIRASLTKAADGFQAWTDSFTRDAKNVFAVEEEIAGLIAKTLSLKLGASSAAATASVNPQAFELYVQARQAWNLRTSASLDRAEELLQRALALAPDFARAHAALADVWSLRGQATDQITSWKFRDNPINAATFAKCQEALALDPDLAEAHASLGLVHWNAWHFADAQRELREAVRLNPSYASAQQWLGRLLLTDGRMEEALGLLRRATELDPLAPRILDNYAWALLLAGRLREAITMCDRAIALQPGAGQAIGLKAVALAQLGEWEAAARLARTVSLEDRTTGWLRAIALASAGQTEEVLGILPSLNEESGLGKFSALAALGRVDDAFAALNIDRLTLTRVDWPLFNPIYDSVRRDARFARLLQTLGLTSAERAAQAWRAAHPSEKLPAKK